VVGEALERPVAGERQDRARFLGGVVVDVVVDDVLADPLLAVARHADHGRHTVEVARDVLLEPLEHVVLDAHLEVLHDVPVGHAEEPIDALLTNGR
jgi:hypothetical protein